MDSQKVYIFNKSDLRPHKRRRVESNGGLSSSWPLRKRAFSQQWREKQQQISRVLEAANQETLDAVSAFLDDAAAAAAAAQPDPRIQEHGAKVPAALVLGGPSLGEHAAFVEQLSGRCADGADGDDAEPKRCFVSLTAAECGNLKGLLKALIAKATAKRDDADDGVLDLQQQHRKPGPKPLNYDLQLLHAWVRQRRIRQVVVAFLDSEAFDGALLADAMEITSIWHDRIPFVLLFGIATSIESFQDKLPRSAIRLVEGQQFDIVNADEVLESVFCTCFESGLRIGPQLSRFLLDRQTEHVQSVQDFVDAVQYAYMCHFFANPLSVFLVPEISFEDISKEHFEALRNIPSFRERTAEELLEAPENLPLVRSLLDSDKALFDFMLEQLQIGQALLSESLIAVDLLYTFLDLLGKTKSRSTLVISALSGEDIESAFFREFLLSTRRASSDIIDQMLGAVLDCLDAEDEACKLAEGILKDLHGLLQSAGSDEPLRSQHSETLQTTVVGKKVQLSKQKAMLSKSEEEYSGIVEDFGNWLRVYFKQRLISMKGLFLREILIYDLRPAHRAVLAPKPRVAIERALLSPHDYLNCECCRPDANGETGGASTQPGTATLYQLYLESGPLINVGDLWTAFSAVHHKDDEEADAKAAMPQFQSGLAELKYLGFVRSTRKKTDHVAKVLWAGL